MLMLYTLLGVHYGELYWTEHVRTRMPTPQEVTSLRIPDNAPLLVTQRITHTTGGRPLALEEARLAGNDTQLTYTLTAITQDTNGNPTGRMGADHGPELVSAQR